MHRTMAVSLMQWNANGLLSKQSEFKQHIANNDHDVICIQETFLKQNKQIRIPGYDAIRNDRLEAKSGLMMLIKHGVKYISLPSPQNVECQVAEMSTKSGKITVINVYVAPTKKIDVASCQALFSRSNTIIVGDFNAKNQLWNSTTDNERGRAIEMLVTQNNFVVLNNGNATYQNTLGHLSYIDLNLVSNNLGTKCAWYTLNNMMGSDHMLIVCRVQDQLIIESESITKWKLDKADWHNYREQCRKHLIGTEVYDQNIENFSQNIIDMINSSANANIPQRKSGRKRKRKALPY